MTDFGERTIVLAQVGQGRVRLKRSVHVDVANAVALTNYEDLARELGAEVVTVGRGDGSLINPLG